MTTGSEQFAPAKSAEHLAEHELLYQLEQDYRIQLEVLVESALIFPLSTTRTLGFIGIDGREHAVPTWQEIRQAVLQKKESFIAASALGYSQLLLVPFAAPLDTFEIAFANIIGKNQELVGLRGTPTSIRLHKPLDLGEDSSESKKLIHYFPETFIPLPSDLSKGKLKHDHLTTNQAWQVLLTQASNQSLTFIRSAPKIPPGELDRTNRLLRMYKNNELLPTEKGFTIESWVVLALTELHKNKRLLDFELFLLFGMSFYEQHNNTTKDLDIRSFTYIWLEQQDPFNQKPRAFQLYTSTSIDYSAKTQTAIPIIF